MIEFLKRLFGSAEKSSTSPTQSKKPPLPQAKFDEFTGWYLAQRVSAVELVPDDNGQIGIGGSRLGGPAWLAEGEEWPIDEQGVPLEFLAQIDCNDCQSLGGYPDSGIIQFFIGRDDLFGANFDDLLKGKAKVRWCDTKNSGSLISPPPLVEVNGVACSDFSPFQKDSYRTFGVALRSVPFVDQIDQSIKDAEKRVYELYENYDITALEEFLESDEQARQMKHHVGGFPAFTQSDIRYQIEYVDYDHVLLRLTSDKILLWGDVGEAVFMIKSADLAHGDFDQVAYSWDCC